MKFQIGCKDSRILNFLVDKEIDVTTFIGAISKIAFPIDPKELVAFKISKEWFTLPGAESIGKGNFDSPGGTEKKVKKKSPKITVKTTSKKSEKIGDLLEEENEGTDDSKTPEKKLPKKTNTKQGDNTTELKEVDEENEKTSDHGSSKTKTMDEGTNSRESDDDKNENEKSRVPIEKPLESPPPVPVEKKKSRKNLDGGKIAEENGAMKRDPSKDSVPGTKNLSLSKGSDETKRKKIKRTLSAEPGKRDVKKKGEAVCRNSQILFNF